MQKTRRSLPVEIFAPACSVSVVKGSKNGNSRGGRAFSRGCDAVNMLSAETCSGGRFRRGLGPRSHGFAYSREDALCDLEILPAPS